MAENGLRQVSASYLGRIWGLPALALRLQPLGHCRPSDTATVRGRVKARQEYQGVKQTVLVRPELLDGHRVTALKA